MNFIFGLCFFVIVNHVIVCVRSSQVATAQFDRGVRPSSRCLQVALAVAAVALQTPAVRRAIGEAERSGRVCSAIRDVHALLRARESSRTPPRSQKFEIYLVVCYKTVFDLSVLYIYD